MSVSGTTFGFPDFSSNFPDFSSEFLVFSSGFVVFASDFVVFSSDIPVILRHIASDHRAVVTWPSGGGRWQRLREKRESLLWE